MNVEKNLIAIGEYFKGKLVDGDYEFVECDSHLAIIKIDGDFTFKLWICSGVSNFKVYVTNEPDSYSNKYFKFTDLEGLNKLKAWNTLMPLVETYKKDVLIARKMQELEELQKQ
jgi:hypothetical protein